MFARLALTCGMMAALPAVGPAGFVVVDDFNRPDANNPGPNWTTRSGQFAIQSGTARGPGGANLMSYNGPVSDPYSARADVSDVGTLNYAALVLGYASLTNNLFIKVQNNDGVGGFDSVGFYFGNNGSNNGAWANNAFIGITPFTTGQITASLLGTTVTLDIDTNFDGTADYSYSRTGVPAGLLGTGVGVGAFGGGTLDNFALNLSPVSAVPAPASAVLLLMGLPVVELVRRRMTPA
jgi:hypothetical protein